METLIQILLFGKGIEKLKILYLIYSIILSFLIMNSLLLLIGFDLVKILTMKSLIEIFLSPVGVLGLFLFLFSCILMFIYGQILAFIGSFLVPSILNILVFIISLIKNSIRLLTFHKPRKIKEWTITEDDVISIINFYKNYKSFITSVMQLDKDAEDASARTFSFFSSMYIVFICYDIYNVNVIVYKIVFWLSLYFLFNSSLIFFAMRNKDKLIELINKSEFEYEPN